MKIEEYVRLDGWLNVRVNPKDNESIFDFNESSLGEYHTLTEASELYLEYIHNQPKRSKREDLKPYITNDDWISRCGALSTMET